MKIRRVGGLNIGFSIYWNSKIRPSEYLHFEVVCLFWKFYIKIPSKRAKRKPAP